MGTRVLVGEMDGSMVKSVSSNVCNRGSWRPLALAGTYTTGLQMNSLRHTNTCLKQNKLKSKGQKSPGSKYVAITHFTIDMY